MATLEREIAEFKAYVKDFYDYDNELISHLSDVVKHGCRGGNGLVYYTEQHDCYNKYSSAIWEIIYQYTDSCGYSVGHFLDKAEVNSGDSFVCEMTWAAFEIVARELLEELDPNNNAL